MIERSRYYGRHHIDELVDIGSPQSRETQLETHGRNLFAVLRNWRDLSEHEHRWNFVLERLRDSFPWLRRLDFDSLGQRVSAQAIRTKSSEEKLSPSDWPDGFFVSLLQLTAVASGDAGGVVAIDEPENSLHPRLIRALIEAMRDWSAARDVTVLLATHSPVVLDCYSDAPEQVFVMQPELDQLPAALDELRKREWLEHYSLGDLYSQLEIGAPSDANL
ncbi:MAG: ATP-binding protein [Deltaproteobacteria bacterium]|nr:ATP-binding protein [Deltaproteobacteria bacterium]